MNSVNQQSNLISIGTAGLSTLMQELANYSNINEVLKAYPESEWFKITSLYISQISELIS